MNAWHDIAKLLLLPLFFAALCGGGIVILVAVSRLQERSTAFKKTEAPPLSLPSPPGFLPRPQCWLAVWRRKPGAVQAALGLHHARSCSWQEGLLGDRPFFIATPLRGWTVVVGSGLPEPASDVDKCFRFIVGLSRKLGKVQFFSVNRAVHHHAWVWAERGRVVRAYAWAGKTIWTQGRQTPAERELALKCFGYEESPDDTLWGQRELVEANLDKVPRLAARWGLDPAHFGETCLRPEQGIAGERS